MSAKRALENGKVSSSKEKRARHEYPVTSFKGFHTSEELNYKSGEFLHVAGKFGTGAENEQIVGKEAILKIRTSGVPNMKIFSDIAKKLVISCRGSNKDWGSLQASFSKDEISRFNVDCCMPALLGQDEAQTQKLINKLKARLRRKQFFSVVETPELYRTKTLPIINSVPKASIQWVDNIVSCIKPDQVAYTYDMEHNRMKEKVVFSDPDKEKGFALLVDFKWKKHPKKIEGVNLNKVETEGLYCIAFPVNNSLRTIRDLRAEHLPLLKSIRDKGVAAIKKHYGINRADLRIFIHYLPQFYYFHVHFTGPSIDFGVFADQARMLDEVIGNLELDPEYYTKCQLVIKVGTDELKRALLPQQ